MKALVFSPMAEADIDDIYDYTEERWGYEQAESYIFGLRDICRSLAERQRRGKSLDQRGRAYLTLRYNSHFVIYRETELRITIIRILHQRMNVRRHL